MRLLIEPECRGGYTYAQVAEIVGPREGEFWDWMSGQTMMICQGEGACEGVAHGMPIVYRWDLERFLEGRPIVD